MVTGASMTRSTDVQGFARRINHRRPLLEAAKELECLCQSMLLFGWCEASMKIDKQAAQREQLNLKRARVESLTKRANGLLPTQTGQDF